MRKIIPYIIFYFIAVVVFAIMSALTFGIQYCICLITENHITEGVYVVSVLVGLFSFALFVAEERK